MPESSIATGSPGLLARLSNQSEPASRFLRHRFFPPKNGFAAACFIHDATWCSSRSSTEVARRLVWTCPFQSALQAARAASPRPYRGTRVRRPPGPSQRLPCRSWRPAASCRLALGIRLEERPSHDLTKVARSMSNCSNCSPAPLVPVLPEAIASSRACFEG